MKMPAKLLVTVVLICLAVTRPGQARAQFVIGDVIKLTVTRVIKAIDLKVQRMQNQTLWLQNAQKALENQLSKLRLSEISGWSSDQQQLFSTYYDELVKIKATIAYYQRIKDITVKQVALVNDYRRAWRLLQQDKHFSTDEIRQMAAVYAGILTDSERNLGDVMMAVSSGKTQMTDEQRLELINRAADRLDENYSDLRRYNTENQILSLQRSRELGDTKATRQLYGLH